MKPLLLFYLSAILLVFQGAFSQASPTKEMLIEKLKKGEIQITPEMIKEGRALALEEQKKSALKNVNKMGEFQVPNPSDTLIDSMKTGADTTEEDEKALKKKKTPTLQDQYDSLVKSDLKALKLKIFGFEIFKQELPATSVPISPADDFIIGIGDEIIIYTWGRETNTKNVFVDKDGYISYPPLQPIRVAGMTLRSAKEALKTSLQNITGLQAQISLGQLSAIRILILGDVEKPGSYHVNSGTSLISALFSSGGIKDIGSLRRVKVERFGRTHKTVDLYNLLLQGSSQGDVQLVTGDVVFVPVVEKRVAVAGFVKRPAIYEAKEKEKVFDLIRFAGGLSPEANGGRIVVERYAKNENRSVLNVQIDPKTGKVIKDIEVEDGDLIKVFPLLGEEQNSVFIFGNVYTSGKYEFRKGMTIRDALPDLTSLKPETFLDYAVVKRVFPPDFHYEYIPFSLSSVYLDTGSFALEPQDTVFIFNRWELLDSAFVEVSGNVRKPGRIPYLANMRASDAVVAAGGFGEDTYLEEVHVLKHSPDASKTTLQKVNMRSVLENYSTEENAVLGPNDKVIVFSEWNFHFRDSVSILGEVRMPGKFKLVNGMTVSDLIKQAGGYNKSSYKLYVEVVRMEVRDDSLQTEKIVKLSFKEDPKDQIDFKLQNRDEVYIRNIIDYEKTISIKLNGLFVFPGAYRAEKGEKLSSVIQRAGGFREDAFLPGIIFTRKRVQEKQQENLKIVSEKLQKQLEKMLTEDVGLSAEDKAYRDILVQQQLGMLEKLKSATALGRVVIRMKDLSSFKGSEYDVKAEDGDELTVRENLNTVSILGEVFAPISVIYSKASNTVGECLDLAGGVDENGDEENIYLVRADGTVVTPNTVGFFTCFNWVEVGPGASIIVPPKVPKKSFWAELQQITSVIYNLAVSAGVVYTIFFQ